MKYRKKPVVIEAIKWTGDNTREILDFTGTHARFDSTPRLVIFTLEGDHIASVGDYIIKGVKGEFYPCREDIFELTYDKVEE